MVGRKKPNGINSKIFNIVFFKYSAGALTTSIIGIKLNSALTIRLFIEGIPTAEKTAEK